MSFESRRVLYEQIERDRNTKVIAYVTGDRPGLEASIEPYNIDYFIHHLDAIGVVDKISLVLYTRGGDPLTAWSIANLLRTFCDSFEVIVPYKCHSAGTLLCLAADNIVMTKQAQLGPIDPTVPAVVLPSNPAAPGMMMPVTSGVSVEDVNAYFEQAKESLPNQPLDEAFGRLASTIHPLVLGRAFRARSQTRMLGRRLLQTHLEDSARIDKILDFLCSDSSGHNYTIGRREARSALGLPVETPSNHDYQIINGIQQDFVDQMELRSRPNSNQYRGIRGSVSFAHQKKLMESPALGAHAWVREGVVVPKTRIGEQGDNVIMYEYEVRSDEWQELRNGT